MSLTVSAKGNGNFEMTPEGVFTARCYRIVDLGTQTTDGQFGSKSQKKVLISWELLDDEVKMADGKPFTIHKKYTASLHEKAELRKNLEAWRGKKFTDEELDAFDLNNILGTYCTVQVVHSDDGKYANINSIMKTKEKPEPVNPDLVYDIENHDQEVFDTFSDKMKQQIMEAPEYGAGQAFPDGVSDPELVPADIPADFLKA